MNIRYHMDALGDELLPVPVPDTEPVITVKKGSDIMHHGERLTAAKEGSISQYLTSRAVPGSMMHDTLIQILKSIIYRGKRVLYHEPQGYEHVVTEQQHHDGDEIHEHHIAAPFTASLTTAEIHSKTERKMNRHRRLPAVSSSEPPFTKIKSSICSILFTSREIFNKPLCRPLQQVIDEYQKYKGQHDTQTVQAVQYLSLI